MLRFIRIGGGSWVMVVTLVPLSEKLQLHKLLSFHLWYWMHALVISWYLGFNAQTSRGYIPPSPPFSWIPLRYSCSCLTWYNICRTWYNICLASQGLRCAIPVKQIHVMVVDSWPGNWPLVLHISLTKLALQWSYTSSCGQGQQKYCFQCLPF